MGAREHGSMGEENLPTGRLSDGAKNHWAIKFKSDVKNDRMRFSEREFYMVFLYLRQVAKSLVR